jgi:hypothetical protein
MHPSLILRLNHRTDKETNLFATGDVYDMPSYPALPREAHKKFISTIINAKTLDAAARSISTATIYYNILKDCWEIKTYSGKERRIGDPVFEESPLQCARKYVEDFLWRHPQFSEAAGSNQWGILQLLESEIIEDVIRRLTRAGVPCLPVHDEIIVPESRRNEAMEALKEAYREVLREAGSFGSVSVKWSCGGKSKAMALEL